MKKINTIKKIFFLIFVFFLMLISFGDLLTAQNMATKYDGILIKQIIWYCIGIVLFFIMTTLKPKWLFKSSFIIYLINIILLILVLLVGDEVNGTKAWFNFSFISFQPSELMKFSLLLFLSQVIDKDKSKTYKEEFFLLLKIFIIFLIPSILTFLEPDTGAVIIYFMIVLGCLLVSNIKKWWFLISFLIIAGIIIIFFYFYFYHQDQFIKVLGTDFFYRMDRIIDFTNQSSYQLQNALIAIGSSEFIEFNIGNHSIYFPEAPTDFVYALTINIFGFLGGILIMLFILGIDFILLNDLKNSTNKLKIFKGGLLIMFGYQQFQNILMNIGLVPIVGITLPFVSYGGSNLLLYFICFGLAFNKK